MKTKSAADPVRARVVEEASRDNGYFYTVETEDGRTYFLNGSQMGSSRRSAGTEGVLVYVSTPSYGLHAFRSDEDE